MEIRIERLTPERTDDYLTFFDRTPHSTGKAEHRCYCACWAGTRGGAAACATAEQRRAVAADYIRDGYLQGCLAYCGDRVVGWCNANTRADCYACISWTMFMGGIRKDDAKVKSVFCFAVAPAFRRRGVASALLERVCADAEKDGFEFVEAYPDAEFTDTEQDFMGPIGLYRAHGFADCYTAGKKRVMRKACAGDRAAR